MTPSRPIDFADPTLEHTVQVLLEKEQGDWVATSLAPYVVGAGKTRWKAWASLMDTLAATLVVPFIIDGKTAAPIAAPDDIRERFDGSRMAKVDPGWLDWQDYDVGKDGKHIGIRVRCGEIRQWSGV